MLKLQVDEILRLNGDFAALKKSKSELALTAAVDGSEAAIA
jgi:hypothetical protein